MIHSRELTMLEQEEAEVGTEWAAAPNITVYWTPVAFAVRSDYDGPDCRHVVLTERIVEAFLALGEKFTRAVDAARAGGDGGEHAAVLGRICAPRRDQAAGRRR